MKSKANIKGHPLHPILIAFPVAFFTGTFIFDLIAIFQKSEMYWQIGVDLELAGIAGGFIAAIPGIIDYLHTVPPNSSAKSRATKHGLINVCMLILFITAFVIRDNEVSPFIVVIEAAGIILLSIAGWMGGTLVYSNQIGLINRYASSGKWNEAHFNYSSGLIEVADAEELKVDQMKLLKIDDKRIVLGRTEKGFTAFDDRCTHKGGSLAGGTMICGTVQCPWHGSQFNVETGEVKAGPASNQIMVYKTEVKNDKVYIVLPKTE